MYILRLWPSLRFYNVKLHMLSNSKIAIQSSLDQGIVDEYIIIAISNREKTKPSIHIVVFDKPMRTLRHSRRWPSPRKLEGEGSVVSLRPETYGSTRAEA